MRNLYSNLNDYFYIIRYFTNPLVKKGVPSVHMVFRLEDQLTAFVKYGRENVCELYIWRAERSFFVETISCRKAEVVYHMRNVYEPEKYKNIYSSFKPLAVRPYFDGDPYIDEVILELENYLTILIDKGKFCHRRRRKKLCIERTGGIFFVEPIL